MSQFETEAREILAKHEKNRFANGEINNSKFTLHALNQLYQQEIMKVREIAKQEFREKFNIDPTKTYEVTGTEKAIIIVDIEHAKSLRINLNNTKENN